MNRTSRAVPCELCGNMFFPVSLKFHQKTCRQRQQQTVVDCPHCGVETSQAELNNHMFTCKAALKASGGFSSSPSMCTSDGRVRCQFCGRGFAANRVHKHIEICGNLKQARPRAPDRTSTQVSSQVYNAMSGTFAPRHRDVAGKTQTASQKAVMEEDRKGWRQKHSEFMAVIQDARQSRAKVRSLGACPDSEATTADDCTPCGTSSPESCSELADSSRKIADSLPKQPSVQKPRLCLASCHLTDKVADDETPTARMLHPPSPLIELSNISEFQLITARCSPRKCPPPLPPPSVNAYQLNDPRAFATKLIAGSRVQVLGLKSSQHLNGQVALLLEFDADAECWLVRLDNGVVKPLRAMHMHLIGNQKLTVR